MGGLVNLLQARQSLQFTQFVYVSVYTCVYVRGYCATMNRIVLRESWLGKWLRQIKHLVSANSLKHVHDHTALQANCTHVQVCMSVLQKEKTSFLHTCKDVLMSSLDGARISRETIRYLQLIMNYYRINHT